jgi:hypothetical protein
MGLDLAAALRVEHSFEPVSLLGLQPLGLGRPVGHQSQNREREQNGGDRLENEQPLPPAQPQSPVQLQQRARDDSRNRVGARHREEQGGNDTGAIFRGEPIGKVQDHAGKETRLRHSQEKAQREEAHGSDHECHDRRGDSPGDHDTGDPDASARLFEDHVARHLEQEITEEEYAGAPAVDVVRKSEILVHAERSKADVGAIHVGDEIDHHDQGKKPPGDLRDCALLERAFHNFTPWFRCIL